MEYVHTCRSWHFLSSWEEIVMIITREMFRTEYKFQQHWFNEAYYMHPHVQMCGFFNGAQGNLNRAGEDLLTTSPWELWLCLLWRREGSCGEAGVIPELWDAESYCREVATVQVTQGPALCGTCVNGLTVPPAFFHLAVLGNTAVFLWLHQSLVGACGACFVARGLSSWCTSCSGGVMRVLEHVGFSSLRLEA